MTDKQKEPLTVYASLNWYGPCQAHVRPRSGPWFMDFGLLDFFYRQWMTQGYQLHSLSGRLLKHFFDNVLLELGGLPHVLPLAVHLK